MSDLQANCCLKGFSAANLVEKNSLRVIGFANESIAIADGIASRGVQ